MSDTAEQITSYAEDLYVLDKLKTCVGAYRQEESRQQTVFEKHNSDETPPDTSTPEDLKRKIAEQKRRQSLRDEIFQAYEQAIPVVASVQNTAEDSIYAELVAQYPQKLVEHVTLDNIKDEIKLPNGLENLFDAAALRQINTKIAVLKQADKQIAKLQTPKASKVKASDTVTNEEDALMNRIKAEAIAYLESSSCKLPTEEKTQQIETIKNAQNFVIKRKNNLCTFNCKEIPDGSQPRFKLFATIDGASYGANNNTSGFGKLTAEDVRTLAAMKKPKEFKAHALAKEEQSAKKAAKVALDNKNKLEELEKYKKLLIAQTFEDYKNLVAHADNKTLFHALAVDTTLGKKMLEMVAPNEDLCAEQDKMRNEIFDKAMWSDSIWNVYKKQDKRESYYDTLPEKVCPMFSVRDKIYDFMDNYQDEQDTSKIIADVAGMQLPMGIAKDIFLQGVFEYGMSMLHHRSFDQQKFDKMNSVLDEYGYQIRFESFRAERTCPEGALPVSSAILNDMHKRHGSKEKQNQIIGLMARFGAELWAHPNRDFSIINEARLMYEVYTQVLFGRADRTHRNYVDSWKTFVTDPNNIQTAKEVAQEITKACRQKDPTKPEVIETINALLIGKSLQNSDIHHIFERKFGGLFQETEQFNYSDNLAVALCIHPADQDPHREAHKFDTKEVYYWRAEDGTIRQGTITQIPEGAEVLRPALYKKDENGQYNPVIDYNTLLVTSSGKRIAYPEIRGNNGQREYFSQQPKTLQTPNLVNNNGGNER